MNTKNAKSKAGKEAKTVRASKPASKSKGAPTATKQQNASAAKNQKGAPSSKGGAAGKTGRKGNDPKRQQRRDIAGQRIGACEAVMAYGEIFSMEDAIRVAELDRSLGKVSNDTAYAKANSWQYYLGINTWYLLVSDLHHDWDPYSRTARSLVTFINHYGLIATIAHCCDTAQQLVSEQPTSSRVGFMLTGNLTVDLQCLRYLKRFTVLKADVLQAANKKNWLKVEKATKAYNLRQWGLNSKYTYLITRIRWYITRWLKHYVQVAADDDLPPIPSGATFEKSEAGGPLSLAERARQYARRAHSGRRFVFCASDPTWNTPRDQWRQLDDVEVDWYEAPGDYCSGSTHSPSGGEDRLNPSIRYRKYLHVAIRHWKAPAKRFNRLVFVPKTYKSYRAVCPESPLNQMMQRKIRDHIWECLPGWVKKRLPLHDQSVMEAVAAAAFQLNLSTTDLSHASDSFSVRVFIDAFPATVREDVMRWRPTHTIVEGLSGDHSLEQLSTMGTGNVWLLMAVFLLACECVACELGRVPGKRMNACFVFGDDMIHPSEIADILYWILDVMGFTVNVDKSFGGSAKYRESCGSEWWHNLDGSVTSLRTIYYPRFPVADGSGKILQHRDYNVINDKYEYVDGISRLIALQHSLYHVSPSAAEFLARAVMRLEPRMTTSIAGSQCDDLWGEFAVGPRKVMTSIVADAPFTDARGKKTASTWFDPELGEEVPVNTRVGHMQLTMVRPPKSKESRKTNDFGITDAILLEWVYLDFLNHGPASGETAWMPKGATQRRELDDPQDTALMWKIVF
jgi:hypothetical protein